MCSLINKRLLLTAYAYLFIMEQQKAQQGSEALQLRGKGIYPEKQGAKNTGGREPRRQPSRTDVIETIHHDDNFVVKRCTTETGLDARELREKAHGIFKGLVAFGGDRSLGEVKYVQDGVSVYVAIVGEKVVAATEIHTANDSTTSQVWRHGAASGGTGVGTDLYYIVEADLLSRKQENLYLYPAPASEEKKSLEGYWELQGYRKAKNQTEPKGVTPEENSVTGAQLPLFVKELTQASHDESKGAWVAKASTQSILPNSKGIKKDKNKTVLAQQQKKIVKAKAKAPQQKTSTGSYGTKFMFSEEPTDTEDKRLCQFFRNKIGNAGFSETKFVRDGGYSAHNIFDALMDLSNVESYKSGNPAPYAEGLKGVLHQGILLDNGGAAARVADLWEAHRKVLDNNRKQNKAKTSSHATLHADNRPSFEELLVAAASPELSKVILKISGKGNLVKTKELFGYLKAKGLVLKVN